MTRLTRKQTKEIQALQRLKDEQIDFTDAPLVADWSRAVSGKFFRPVKKSVTIRLDADVLEWFKQQGTGYQTRINDLLRKAMNDHR